MRLPRTRSGAVALVAIASVLGGCAYEPPNSPYMSGPEAWGPPSSSVIYVAEEAPLVQPATVFIDVAPPPMLIEVMPPRPSYDAVWIGGYWGWQSQWVWCNGRWAPPPRPGYVWMHPYYENRGGIVVFVPGFWRGPHVRFAPPPPRLRQPVVSSVRGGVRPVGPPGTFVPPPPGSRPGVVVPAPIGTPPGSVAPRPGPGTASPWPGQSSPPRWEGARGPFHRPPRADDNEGQAQPPAVPDRAVVVPGRRPPPFGGWQRAVQPAVPTPAQPVRDSVPAPQPPPQPAPSAQPDSREQPGQRPRWGARPSPGAEAPRPAQAPAPAPAAREEGQRREWARGVARDRAGDRAGERTPDRRSGGNRRQDDQ